MHEQDNLLGELVTLHMERKRKAEELAAIDRQIEIVLFPHSGDKRKKQARSGKDWERLLGGNNERITEVRRALVG